MAEKALNELPRDLRGLYTRGADALQRDNFDYAIEMFSQVLAKEPRQHEVRKALRTAQIKKAGTGGGFFKKMISGASSSPLVAKAEMTVRNDPAAALQIAEQILSGDPNSSAGHRIVVKSAMAMEMPNTAAMSLEVLMRNSPKDRDIAIQFANALADVGQVQRAERMLADFARAQPNDQELNQALKDISARNTLARDGYRAAEEGTGNYRGMLKDKDEAAKLEQEQRIEKTGDVNDRMIRDYEERLALEPNNLKLLRNLAETYKDKKEYDRALEYYEKIKQSEGTSDPSLERSISEVTARRFDQRMSQLDPAAADYPEKLAAFQAEKAAYQLADCQQRADRFPTDLQIRFELGQLLFQAGKVSEAIQELQKAKSNPHRRVAAMSLLGQCFARKNMNDMAARSLQEALKEKLVFDDEKKELVYVLGTILEKMGKREEAIEQFKQIYEMDIGYKDVAKKVDDYYSSQG